MSSRETEKIIDMYNQEITDRLQEFVRSLPTSWKGRQRAFKGFGMESYFSKPTEPDIKEVLLDLDQQLKSSQGADWINRWPEDASDDFDS